jgi:hypothetical protein
MKLSTAFLLGATALAGVTSFGETAHAIPFNAGSIAIQATTSTTTALSTTTAFALSSPTNLVSGAGDFTGLSASAITGFGPTLDMSNLSTFNFSDAGIGSFVATPGTLHILSNGGGVLSFDLVGTYTIGSDFSNAGSTMTADETFSLTQTNGAGAISISGTFQSPQNVVPEPMTLAVFGASLAGLGVLRRRTKA